MKNKTVKKVVRPVSVFFVQVRRPSIREPAASRLRIIVWWNILRLLKWNSF